MRTLATLAALAVLAATAAPGCATRGYQRSEKVTDSIHDTTAAVEACGASRKASVDSMDALVGGPKEDLPARFRTFNTSVDRAASADGNLRKAVATMKSDAEKRFHEWGGQDMSYTDGEMREQSRDNRDGAAETFGLAARDADALAARSAAFVLYLTDLRTLLSNDLTPDALARAEEFAEKARASSREVDELTPATLASLEKAASALSYRSSAD